MGRYPFIHFREKQNQFKEKKFAIVVAEMNEKLRKPL